MRDREDSGPDQTGSVGQERAQEIRVDRLSARSVDRLITQIGQLAPAQLSLPIETLTTADHVTRDESWIVGLNYGIDARIEKFHNAELTEGPRRPSMTTYQLSRVTQ